MSELDDFLKNVAEQSPQSDQAKPPEPVQQDAVLARWDQIVTDPNVVKDKGNVYLLTGDLGKGKTALGVWLVERYSHLYHLTPALAGFPQEKATLLPPHFLTPTVKEVQRMENSIVLIDEAGLQLPLDDTKVRKKVLNFLTLSRQRRQILILSYHFPRLVLVRYLPFIGGFFFKRPPYLIQFAGKSAKDYFTNLLGRAEERFKELPKEDVNKHTYVVSPHQEWNGLLPNPVPSFWSQDLSESWSGVEWEDEEGEDSDKKRGGREPNGMRQLEMKADEMFRAEKVLDAGGQCKICSKIFPTLFDGGVCEGCYKQWVVNVFKKD